MVNVEIIETPSTLDLVKSNKDDVNDMFSESDSLNIMNRIKFSSQKSTHNLFSRKSRNSVIRLANIISDTNKDDFSTILFIRSQHLNDELIIEVGNTSVSNNINESIINNLIQTIEKKSIANSAISKIKEIEKNGESVIEIHKLFDNLIKTNNIEMADLILKQSVSFDFPLTVLIAFLTSTLPFKHKFNNRDLVFEKVKKIAEEQLGEEKLSKSIFKNLK